MSRDKGYGSDRGSTKGSGGSTGRTMSGARRVGKKKKKQT